MKRRLVWSAMGAFLATMLTLVVPAQQFYTGKPRFTTFSLRGAVLLTASGINDFGTVSGYFTDSSGNFKGFERTSDGNVHVFTDSASPGYTAAYNINDQGTVTGQIYVSGQYSGFLYNHGHFFTYNVPDQPVGTTTAVVGITNLGQEICGWVGAPPFSLFQAYTSSYGKVDIFSVHDSPSTFCYGLNNHGSAAGTYIDSSGADRGYVRSPGGAITNVDFPGASKVPGPAPCLTETLAGTVADGVNDAGTVSGHFWDNSYNEHGYRRFSNGYYQRFDVPGAYQTGGGNINAVGMVAGHYTNSSCNNYGFIASF